VLIDYANRQRGYSAGVPEAMLIAGLRRFPPIILTSPMTFGVLAAMIFETLHEVRFMLSMALSLGFGILVEPWQGTRLGFIYLFEAEFDFSDQVDWSGHGPGLQVSDAWLMSGGAAYDSAMMEEEDVVPNMPVGENWRFALGSRYDWSEDLSLTGVYDLVWAGDIDMDVTRGPQAGRVSGTYEDVSLHVFCWAVEWRF
jgi:hypothetical protein